jgi:two-component system NtrC family response regulator
VRELLNAVESALSIEPGSPTLYPTHIPEHIRARVIAGDLVTCSKSGENRDNLSIDFPTAPPTLKDYRTAVIESAEKKYLHEVMQFCAWDVERACRLAGLKRARLYQLLKKYGIAKND